MQVHLHPTCQEALTVSDKTLTRWSLATDPATILAQLSVAPGALFTRSMDPCGRVHALGGVTVSAGGLLVALEQPLSRVNALADRLVLEWRHWEDLSLARIHTISQMDSQVLCLAGSPDGHWLVLGPRSPARIFLLDWQTGELLSHHAIGGYRTTALAFDPTSTWVAGFACHDNWGHCMLFRLNPAERALLRPPGEQWWSDGPPDEVSGSMALSVVHWELDRTGLEWPVRDLADTACQVAFSPDSRMVLFNPMNSCRSGFGLELVAYEVVSGQRLWYAHHQEESGGSFLVAPDSETLLVPMRGDMLLRYRLEDGVLLEQLPSGLSEPVQALAFDHEGKLWLATEERLVQYQPQD